LQEAEQLNATQSQTRKVERLCEAVRTAASIGNKAAASESYAFLRQEYSKLSEKEKPLYSKQCIDMYQYLTQEVKPAVREEKTSG
jgi:hypothetical protein